MIESGRRQLLPYRLSATKSDALRMRGEDIGHIVQVICGTLA